MNNRVFENNFLQLLCEMLERAQLPSALLDSDFRPVWSSIPALLRWPLLGTEQGAQGILAGFDLPQVRSEIANLGFFCTPDSTQNIFAQAPALFYAAPAECGAYYVMQPPQKTRSASGLRPSGLELSVSSFESHYRTPLSAIFSAVSVLGQGLHQKKVDVKFQPYLEEIQKSSLQLLRNNQMISEYTYLANGLYLPHPEQLELYDFLRQLLSDTAELVASIGIDFVFHLPSGSLINVCDTKLVCSVLLNLISNSCRFTRPNNQITVRVRHVKENLLISVSDKGLGIPAEKYPFVFQPYFSYSHNEAQFAGNGLGLSIAQQSAALLGGTLTLTSISGKGTTAVFSMPVNKGKLSSTLAYSGPLEFARDRFSVLRIMLADSLPPAF